MRGRGDEQLQARLASSKPPKLYHYCSEPLAGVGDVKQIPDDDTQMFGGFYPCGLWFAPERTWPEWADQFRDKESFKHRYQVKFAEQANIIRLSTPDEASEFSLKYAHAQTSDGSVTRIKWEAVAETADGIRLDIPTKLLPHWKHWIVTGLRWQSTQYGYQQKRR
jgi:hypothetical protein